MNICVFGVGGVGGYFGGKIAYAFQNEEDAPVAVYFIARGSHCKEIQKSGLILNTDDRVGMVCRPTLVTDTINDIPDIDLCLMCVKVYDLHNACTALQSKITKNTVIIPLLNGVDIYERIWSIVRNSIILPSCLYVGTHIEKPGTVTQKGGACRILFGPGPETANYIPYTIFKIFDKSGIQYTWNDDPYPEIWGKFIFIASFGLVSACYRKSLGQIMESPELKKNALSVMYEIQNIMKKKEIAMPDNIIENTIKKADDFPYAAKTSLLRDIESFGKRNELDLFGGTIIRFGASLHIDTPATQYLCDAIQKGLR